MLKVSFINICSTRQNIMHYMNSSEMIPKWQAKHCHKLVYIYQSISYILEHTFIIDLIKIEHLKHLDRTSCQYHIFTHHFIRHDYSIIQPPCIYNNEENKQICLRHILCSFVVFYLCWWILNNPCLAFLLSTFAPQSKISCTIWIPQKWFTKWWAKHYDKNTKLWQ